MLELNRIYNMDCLDGMKLLDDNSVDSIVTDPPYELGFMGKKWDMTGIAYNIELWQECLRVLKPGGHLLAFGGTRTYHRMTCAIEDAGFEIRDCIQWIYGSGFTKSHNISKAIDKKFGAKRAKQWDGWGTALKPANEPIVVARKPISEKTIADNVLKWGTGGINIDDCRIPTNDKLGGGALTGSFSASEGWDRPWRHDEDVIKEKVQETKLKVAKTESLGRFPANVILDEEAGKLLDEQTGVLTSGKVKPEGFKGKYTANVYGKYANNVINPETVYGDSGGASRFFYCAKASKKERGEGNNHPTVKPLSLIKYLITLVTPPGGICLDPFEGSGTHALACKDLGFNYIGFELDKTYYNIATKRISDITPEPEKN